MSSLLRIALCGDASEEDLPAVDVELNEDEDSSESLAEATSTDQELEELSASLESLFDYRAILGSVQKDNLSDSNTGHAIAQICARRFPTVSLESFQSGGSEQAMENFIRNGFDNYLQLAILGHKHTWNAAADLFKTVDAQMDKYSEKLDDTHAEFKTVKGEFRNEEHNAYLGELWYFFITKNGIPQDMVPALDFDLAASSFLLDTLPAEALATLKKVLSILGNAKFNSAKSAHDTFAAIGKLKSVEDMVGTKFIGDGILFNRTTVTVNVRTVQRIVEVDGKKLHDLAEVAARTSVTEKSSAIHTSRKIVNKLHPVGPIVMAFLTLVNKLTSKEIEEVILHGKKYIANVRKYRDHVQGIKNMQRDLESTVEKLKRNIDPSIPGVQEGLKQVNDYIRNLTGVMAQPASSEVKRSIRGAKYCNYLALRLIYNAKKYF